MERPLRRSGRPTPSPLLPWVPSALVAALGCAGSPAAAAPAAAAAAQDEPRTLRFGDAPEHAYETPFFPGADHDPAIPTPDSILGQPHGSRLSHHDEVLACFRAWAEASPRVVVESHGRTHEGRELIHAIVTAPANHARLDAIRADLARLHDPRGLDEEEAGRILERTPPVAWMGYSIHGDELSGSDGALALGYHLAASRDADVERLLERVVVVIDPVMNPDGRERIIGMVEQATGYTPNLDYDDMHRGRWPYGRGNHYLFDMNRDWMGGTQPETRGRWRAVLSFHPQLFVDAHEMGSQETFLFYPQAEPLNPHLPPRLIAWQRAYAEEAAKDFDAQGWTYYTREWADGWAPFYSDSWGSLAGGTGILYEQARTLGSALRRASGTVLTYREAVHHQAVASLANLRVLSERRDEVLGDYLAAARETVAADTPGNDRLFVVRPRPGSDREERLVRALRGQEIEVFRATADFQGTNAVGARGERLGTAAFPAGSLLVPARQPMGRMVRAYLELDTRLDDDALLLERRDLEQKGTSRIYDSTSWSLAHALDLDGWWIDAVEVPSEPCEPREADGTAVLGEAGATGAVAWAVDGTPDASVAFAARALDAGLQVHLSDEPFTAAGRELPPGSLVVRRNENEGTPEEIEQRVVAAARGAGIAEVLRASTSLSPDEGADLGGGHFTLLVRPRAALLSNAPVAPDSYGHLWYLLDHELGVSCSVLDAQAFAWADLRRYNVLVLPPSWGGIRAVLEARKDDLASWVSAGGTLIACEDAAAALTKGRLGLSQVTLRADALEDLEAFGDAVQRELGAREVAVDPAEVWGDAPPAEAEEPGEAAEPDDDDAEEEASDDVDEERERWARLFAPRGATVRGLVRPRSWMAAGTGEELPVDVTGPDVFLARSPVQTIVRLAPERLRLSGLLWPEARERLAGSAWCTVERSGNGQIVLFAALPGYRGHHAATGRLFANAVVYGPGCGASAPVGW